MRSGNGSGSPHPAYVRQLAAGPWLGQKAPVNVATNRNREAGPVDSAGDHDARVGTQMPYLAKHLNPAVTASACALPRANPQT